MRDHHNNGKQRDLRKATRRSWSFDAYSLYDKLHGPKPSIYYTPQLWMEWNEDRERWVKQNCGICYE